MSPRTVLLAAATACSWTALFLVSSTSAAPPAIAVVAAGSTLGVWHRLGRQLSILPALACVLMVVAGTSVPTAGAAGVLVLVHIVLVDLADDAHGSAGPAVALAVRRLAPGAVAGVVATAAVATGALIGGAVPDGPLSVPLLLAAPLLLLSAFLVTLGMATRRPFWGQLARPTRMSAVTRRYLARAGLRP